MRAIVMAAVCAAMSFLMLAACTAPVDVSGVPDAAGLSAGIPGEAPWLRGRITAVGRDGRLLVEALPGGPIGSDRALVSVTPQTRILRRDGSVAGVESLAEGRQIRLWITGPMLKSYPPQVTASAIVLE